MYYNHYVCYNKLCVVFLMLYTHLSTTGLCLYILYIHKYNIVFYFLVRLFWYCPPIFFEVLWAHSIVIWSSFVFLFFTFINKTLFFCLFRHLFPLLFLGDVTSTFHWWIFLVLYIPLRGYGTYHIIPCPVAENALWIWLVTSDIPSTW